MEITFNINQADVYKEVAQTTSYTGAKMDDDVNAYERIFTTDEDQSQLKRFWDESRAEVAQSFASKLVSEDFKQVPIYEGANEDSNIATFSASAPPNRPPQPPPPPPTIIGYAPTYTLVLEVSSSFETALQPSMQLSLFSFFVQSITAKWYVFTNKKEAGEYADRANALLEDVREKAFYKKKPKRPTYN